MPVTIHPESIESQQETPSTRTFLFGLKEPLDYDAGQYITVRLANVEDPRGPQRPFTLSSTPTDAKYIRITTRMTGSPFKKALSQIAADGDGLSDRVTLKGPMGEFILETARPAIMIAGGIGITPFISMIRYARDEGLATPVTLLYSNDTPEEIAFHDELDEIAGKADWLTVIHTITQPADSQRQWSGRTGRIDGELIAGHAKEMDEPIYYVCGPPAMVSGMSDMLQDELGIAVADLRTEKFSGY